MLSGFILTYARLSSSNPDKLDPLLIFVKNRVRSIYPLYLCSLITAIAIDAVKQLKVYGTFTLDPGPTVASVFLVQAWVPQYVEFVYQNQCWFLSCIVVSTIRRRKPTTSKRTKHRRVSL